MRLDYDFTIDEAIDTNRRAMARSETMRSIRSRQISITSIVSGIALFVTWVSRSMMAGFGTPSIFELSIVVVIALAVSVATYFGYGRLYDWTVSRRLRRLVEEQWAKSDSHTCAIETRPDELWAYSDGTSVSHRWNDMEAVVDTGDAIELQFRNGLIVARNRAFRSSEERAEFLSITEAHAR
jgi:hypothetical protein